MSSWLKRVADGLTAAVRPLFDGINLPRLRPGSSDATEVRHRLGEPTRVFRNADGSETWEYTRQPGGTVCYMIDLNTEHFVTAVRQVLTNDNLRRVQIGMAQDDVLRLLGTPARKTVFDNLGEDIWEWRIEGVPSFDETYFMVHFALSDGYVKKTSSRVATRG